MYSAWYQKQQDLLNDINKTKVFDNEIAIWYIGQCGFVIKTGDIKIYIDPVLNDIQNEEGHSIRLYEVPFEPEQTNVDYVFCTHEHIDHMAKDTLEGIYKNNPNVKFIVPGVCEKYLKEWGICQQSVTQARAEKVLELGNIKVHPISTAHPIHRKDENGSDCSLAYFVRIADVHILHLGDTYITEQLLDDLKKLPNPDVLMIPINGADYYREKAGIIGNMSVREAAQLVCELDADLTIPMHYDMIEGNTCNPLCFLEELWSKEPHRKIELPRLGERILLKKRGLC